MTFLARYLQLHPPSEKPDRWLFLGQGTQPPHQNTIGHRWRSTRKTAGLEAIKLHDLRHFCASGRIAAGCDAVTVRRTFGHTKASTTLSLYSRLWPKAEDRTHNETEGARRAVARDCGLSAD